MRSTTLPPTTDAALGPSRAPAVLPLQLKVFGVLSFILFPTLLTLILRQMPLASKSRM